LLLLLQIGEKEKELNTESGIGNGVVGCCVEPLGIDVIDVKPVHIYA